MKVIVIILIVGSLGRIHKKQEKRLGELEIRGKIETVHITALLRSQEYLEESWRAEETCCHWDFNDNHQWSEKLTRISLWNSPLELRKKTE